MVEDALAPILDDDAPAEEKKRSKNSARRDILKPFPIPDVIQDGATADDAWQSVQTWLRTHYWFENQRTYDILGIWIVQTYLMRFVDTGCMLLLHGMSQSGKSQLTNVIALVSHMGCVITDPTSAVLFRLVDMYPGMTLALDEFTFNQKDDPDSSEIFRIVRASFTRGVGVARVEEIDGKRVPAVYSSFGPKIVNTTKLGGIPSDIINRSLAILCLQPPKGERGRRLVAAVDTPDAERVRATIAGLVATVKPETIIKPDMSEFEPELRLRDIGNDLALAASVLNRLDVLKDYLRHEMNERRERNRESRYGQLLNVVGAIAKECTGDTVEFTMKELAELWTTYNDMDEDEKPPGWRALSTMLSNLGFERRKEHKTSKSFKTFASIGRGPLELLLQQYGVSP